MELDTARLALHQSLQEAELARAGMEAELQTLRAERTKLQDKVIQVKNQFSEGVMSLSSHRRVKCSS